MLFIPSNREDILKYYKNTYVKFKETGDTLYFIEHVYEDRIVGTSENGQPFTLYMDDEHPYELEYVLPQKSFFQYGEHAAMLRRIPARQYYRGVSPDNTQIMYLAAGTVRKFDLGFGTISAFVNKKQFFSLSQARKSPNYSCVLSPRMMYQRTNRGLYMDFVQIGTVYANEVRLSKPIFKTEVEDLMKQTGDKYKVVVAE